MNAEYSVLLQRAHDVGLKVICVDGLGEYRHSQLAEGIKRLIEKDPTNKIAFWSDAAHIARRGAGSAPRGWAVGCREAC